MPVLRIVQNDGLTLGEVLQGIPHDVPALFVYVLIGLFVGMIVAGSRRKPRT